MGSHGVGQPGSRRPSAERDRGKGSQHSAAGGPAAHAEAVGSAGICVYLEGSTRCS